MMMIQTDLQERFLLLPQRYDRVCALDHISRFHNSKFFWDVLFNLIPSSQTGEPGCTLYLDLPLACLA
jgi:hypothetical protein